VKHVAALLCGLLFAIGLGVSGMTQPEKVIGFLDFTGNWDPSLAFVMLGAIGVHLVALRFVLKRKKPVLDERFHVSAPAPVDRKLVLGAGLFGIGWGLSGYCPGPAVVSLGAGSIGAIVIGIGTVVGMLLHHYTFGEGSRSTPPRVGERAPVTDE
jgi:uncharacterized membrane protein YedE/YeeE